MSNKVKLLENLRDQIKAGRVSQSKHAQQYFLDKDGKKVYVTDEGALDAINERIEQEKGE